MAALAERLRAMSREELSWRIRTQLRTQTEQAAAAIRKPRWRREDIRHVLAVNALPGDVQADVQAGDWPAVHRGLRRVLRARPSRFVLNPAARRDLRRSIGARWPEAEADATRRATAVAEGTFDLLGYRALSFDADLTGDVDWHFDPVHRRRMPMTFWSNVPYLDPAYGDHKIIWELNRQQHWLTLSRGLWLTGDRGYAAEMVRDCEAWLAANPPLTGGNWASMLELAFRSLSWLWGLHAMLSIDTPDAGEVPWLVDLLVALDRQLTHVERHLSLYFSPNTHLTGEALALYVAGTALPELSASARWLDRGRTVLLHEIDRQIEPDGGHVERSTHYHRYTLDFYLLALLTARRSGDLEAAERFEAALQKLAPFALAMADRHGRLPRIGDDDAGRLWPIVGRDPADIRDSLGVAAAVLNRPDWAPWGASEEVLWLTTSDRAAFTRALDMEAGERRIADRRTLPFRAAERRSGRPQTSSVLMFPTVERRSNPAERRGRLADRRGNEADSKPDGVDHRTTQVFPQTGFVTSATESGDHLIIDAGPHGYLNGGHAHADALSVVLTLRGRPVLVDPGTPTYTMDAELRDQLRSSVSHNTLTIDGASSALPDGPFHWRTRADATLEVVRHNAGFALVEAQHQAYGHVGHRRVVLAGDGGYLFVDQVTGSGLHEAAQHWHFDPQWRVGCDSGQSLRLVHDGGDVAWLLYEPGALWLVNGDDASPCGWVSPAYGVRVRSWTARITQTIPAPFTRLSWCGAALGAAVPTLERVACEADIDGSVVAARVRCGVREWITMLRPGDRHERLSRASVAEAFETDARGCQCSWVDGKLTSLCLADGSYVRVASSALDIESDGPLADLHIARVGDRLDCSASVPPARIRLQGALVTGADCIVMNGRERRLQTGDDSIEFTASDWSDAPQNMAFQDYHDVRYSRFR